MRRLVFLIALALLAPSVFGAPVTECPDADVQQLMSKLSAPLSPDNPAPAKGRDAYLIWHFDALDNASCVRSVDDVDGDGLMEAISGHDIFQDPENFFCFAGSSFSEATVIWSLETSGGLSGGYFWGVECLEPAADADGVSPKRDSGSKRRDGGRPKRRWGTVN